MGDEKSAIVMAKIESFSYRSLTPPMLKSLLNPLLLLPHHRITQDASVILFPIAITFYITWWFVHFVDGFFSPIYAHLGIDIFGLGFITSITFIFLVGVFMSSWLGASVLSLGEWFNQTDACCSFILYNASKQINQNTQAFKESGHYKAFHVSVIMLLGSFRHLSSSRSASGFLLYNIHYSIVVDLHVFLSVVGPIN
ncbi:LOW QUALITY PROTEIN: hypothetical protein NC652_018235 [Populus alba x Populus x berolinensis]|nr:LOW QUALITY PROTEIN: hypothetical protein NC652_018235 [Populus alba x Populus x berolinensis]